MIQRLAKRYWLLALLVVIGLAALAVSHRPTSVNTAATIPPAQVIITRALVIDQGVSVEWLESRPGTYPIAGYLIERSREGGEFTSVARVEHWSQAYLDAEGREGDAYRIKAEDDRSPAGQSPASEQLVAVPAKPGSTIAVGPPLPRVLGASTAVEQAATPEAKVILLQRLMAQTFIDIDTAVQQNDLMTTRSLLAALQIYQRQALSLWPQLSASQKEAVARPCADHLTLFKATSYILPEEDQRDSLLIDAGCHALLGDLR